jgi:hypothetical protein
MLTSFVNVCESANYKKLRNFGENVMVTRSLSWHFLFSDEQSTTRQTVKCNDSWDKIKRHKKSLFLNDLEKANAIAENVKGYIYTYIHTYIHTKVCTSRRGWGYLHSFLSSALDGREWLTWRIDRGEHLDTHWHGAWVGPRAGLDILEKRKCWRNM